MPGLFAASLKSAKDIDLIDIATKKLCHEEWFGVTRHDDLEAQIVFGKISNGILNPDQPKKSEDGRYLVFLEGEIYNSRELWNFIGSKFNQNRNDADLVIALNKTGAMDSWIESCHGSFTIMIWDNKEKSITIGNDRYGLRPHYYLVSGNEFVLGPEVKFLAELSNINKSLDIQSLVDYFAFQTILGDRTFFKKVNVLPYATVLTVKSPDWQVQLNRYWDFDRLSIKNGVGFEEAVATTSTLFQKAIDQQTKDNYRFGVFLSGGLDSRMILGCMKHKSVSLNAFTYGLKNSRDLSYAARMCRAMGVKHHRMIMDSGEWLKDIADDYMKLTEGFQSLFHAHAFHKRYYLRNQMDVNMSGYIGDLIMGGSRIIDDLQKDDWLSLARSLYKYSLKQGLGFTTDYELRQLFTDRVWNDPERRPAWKSFIQSLEKFRSFEFENIPDFFHITYRARRQLLNSILVAYRPYFEDREPFYDNDLFDYLYTVPVMYRAGRKLQAGVLDTLTPQLARIPDSLGKVMYTSQRIPLMVERTKRGTTLFLTKASGGRIKDLTREYQEYSKWLREDLGEWSKGILLNEQTLDRGILAPDFVKSTLDEHLNGKEDCQWKIGLMLSLEIMLRQFDN